MERASCLLLLALVGACSGSRSAALQTCTVVPGEKVAAALGTTLTKQEIDGVRDTASVKSSGCNYDFANGDALRVVLFDYAPDSDMGREPNGREPNAPVTEQLGYPVYHDQGESQYEAYPAANKVFIVRLFHNPTKPKAGSTYNDGTIAVGTFENQPVENRNDKAVAIARLIKF